MLTATANFSGNITLARVGSSTNATGNFTGIPPGTYDITVKSGHTLLNVKRSVVISGGWIFVNMGTLLEGNANESTSANANIINLSDFTTVSAAYGKSVGQPGYNDRANFDCNTIVNLSDFTLLSGNYLKSSPITIP